MCQFFLNLNGVVGFLTFSEWQLLSDIYPSRKLCYTTDTIVVGYLTSSKTKSSDLRQDKGEKICQISIKSDDYAKVLMPSAVSDPTGNKEIHHIL